MSFSRTIGGDRGDGDCPGLRFSGNAQRGVLRLSLEKRVRLLTDKRAENGLQPGGAVLSPRFWRCERRSMAVSRTSHVRGLDVMKDWSSDGEQQANQRGGAAGKWFFSKSHFQSTILRVLVVQHLQHTWCFEIFATLFSCLYCFGHGLHT